MCDYIILPLHRDVQTAIVTDLSCLHKHTQRTHRTVWSSLYSGCLLFIVFHCFLYCCHKVHNETTQRHKLSPLSTSHRFILSHFVWTMNLLFAYLWSLSFLTWWSTWTRRTSKDISVSLWCKFNATVLFTVKFRQRNTRDVPQLLGDFYFLS